MIIFFPENSGFMILIRFWNLFLWRTCGWWYILMESWTGPPQGSRI